MLLFIGSGIRYLFGEKDLKTKLTARFVTLRFSTHYRPKATKEVQRGWKDQFYSLMQIITTTNKIKTYNSTMHLKFVNFKTVLHLNKIYRVSHNTLHMSHTSHFHTCNTIFYLLNEKYQVSGILSVLLKKSSTWGRSSLSPHPDASQDIPVKKGFTHHFQQLLSQLRPRARPPLFTATCRRG